jgi:uncharacterized protein (TIGR01370 family)
MAEKTAWVVYYADQAPPDAFNPYHLVVLESESYPPLRPLSDRGKTLLGYLSLGEVEDHRRYFASVKAEKILLQENKDWKGSYFVDVRDPRWTRRVIEQLIPQILRRGFDGLFLDTLDNPAHLERVNPSRFRGMTAAAARLVRTIRLHFPTIKVMMNRGYEILPEVEGHIDMVLGESVFADYDFKTKSYRLVAPQLYQEQVKILQAARKRRPDLGIFTLDYWDPADKAGIARIYREQRANGFEPYVATVELDRIIPEPQP